MKALLVPAAAVALLSGCVGYGDPVGYGYGYPNSGYPNTVGYGYGHPGPVGGVAPVYGTYGGYPSYQRAPAMRDRDRDGVPNAFDARPSNPYLR